MDNLLPGFRFYPTEEELVSFYLLNKLKGTRTDLERVIPVVDIYDYNPWDLPNSAGELCPEDSEQWFFFIPRQEREARGGRPNRLTTEGYWKATGSPGDVYSSQNLVIGRKRTMVFYVGRAPHGTKTVWKMNEYKAVAGSPDEASSSSTAANSQLSEELSLCRIYKRSRSLRTFDRRPPSEVAAGGRQEAAHRQHRGNDDVSALNPPIAPEVTDWSLDNSSPAPGGHTAAGNPSQTVGSGNDPCTSADGEPSWDSDQFNWFEI